MIDRQGSRKIKNDSFLKGKKGRSNRVSIWY